MSTSASDSSGRAALEESQRGRLASLLAEVFASNPFYRQKFGSIPFDPRADPLDRIPFTTRAEVQQDQLDHPPYGTILTYPVSRYTRMHQTSGSSGVPLRWLDTPESWEWWKRCWSCVYDGAGVTQADRIVFAFSFGPFIGFWAAFESATDRGCLCLAAGGMSSVARLRYILDNSATAVCCTPTYALHMAEVAAGEKIDLAASAVRSLIVAGEPGGNIPETRAKIESAWGARVFDHAGMTEIGAWGFETMDAPGGLFVNESEFIAESIDPKSLAPVADGEVGELVLTNLGRTGSPLVRYRTGDLVRMRKGGPALTIQNPIPARRDKIQNPFAWCEGGVLSRVDDMLFIRGNNVFPSAIEGILRGVPGVAEFRLTVMQRDALSELCIEVEPAAGAEPSELAVRVTHAIRDRLNFRPEVRTVAMGTLPRFEMKTKRLIRRKA